MFANEKNKNNKNIELESTRNLSLMFFRAKNKVNITKANMIRNGKPRNLDEAQKSISGKKTWDASTLQQVIGGLIILLVKIAYTKLRKNVLERPIPSVKTCNPLRIIFFLEIKNGLIISIPNITKKITNSAQ